MNPKLIKAIEKSQSLRRDKTSNICLRWEVKWFTLTSGNERIRMGVTYNTLTTYSEMFDLQMGKLVNNHSSGRFYFEVVQYVKPYFENHL